MTKINSIKWAKGREVKKGLLLKSASAEPIAHLETVVVVAVILYILVSLEIKTTILGRTANCKSHIMLNVRLLIYGITKNQSSRDSNKQEAAS